MKYSAGYIKDLLACLFFGLLIIFIYLDKININNKYILSVLIICFITDGLYSLFPYYHNTIIGYNMPTYIIITSGICLFYILYQLI